MRCWLAFRLRTHYSAVVPRRPSQSHRALALLASSPDGCTEAVMRADGFSLRTMVALVRAELATAQNDRVVAGGRTFKVVRLRITEAGREALTAGQHNAKKAPRL